jgi:ribose 5-phosphate isomerase B
MIRGMRVFLGSDHAGFELKARLIEHVNSLGHEAVDCGAFTYVATDDYPPPCVAAATATVNAPGSLGIVVGGSGNGEQIAANKVPGIRAALVWSDETARLAREHNDAQIISIGARNHPVEDALRFVEIFLATPFSKDPRHERRIALLAEYEQTGSFSEPPEAPEATI